MTSWDDGHVAAVAPGQVPGGMYIRIGSVETGQLLDAYPVTSNEEAMRRQKQDEAMATRWFVTHPTDEVHIYLYDGDTGQCCKTVIFRGPLAQPVI